MYSEIESINYLLALVNAAPVQDINDSLPDAQSARLRLKEATVWLLKKGWWFNTEYNLTLPVDSGTKELVLPYNTMKVTHSNYGHIVVRNGKAYDPYNHTFTFPDITSMCVELTLLLEWDDIPSSAQDYIRFAAGREHVLLILEDYRKADALLPAMQAALRDVDKDDMEIKQRNMLNSPTSRQIRGGVRPMGRRLRSGQ